MSTLVRITLVEANLFRRELSNVVFAVVFPAVLLLALGAIPALREPSEEFGGARFVDHWAPSALVMGIGIVALQHIPSVLATYRERGILRRVSTTPVHPGQLLLAQLIVAMFAAVVAAALLVVSAWLVLGVDLPRRPVWFAFSFVVGFAAVLALGLLIAAIAPNARVAGGLGMVVYLVAMFIGGVFLPRFLMPEGLLRLGEYLPPGVVTLQATWTGENPSGGLADLPRLAIMALVAVLAAVSAARLFRWE